MIALDRLLAERPLRRPGGGKEERGTVVVVGGPPTCPGAALLCAVGALRAGAGRVQAVVHPEVAAACGAAAWELLVEAWDHDRPVPEAVADRLRHADVVVVGPGHHRLSDEAVEAVAHHVSGTLVLDAGALPAVPILRDRGALVIAPNPSEAAELAGTEGDEAALAKALIDRFGRPVAVRGEVTVVAEQDRRWRSDPSPAGLGIPGSGDVYLGLAAGLLATGHDPASALAWATVAHARAGERAGCASPGALASEVLRQVPAALDELG